MKTEVLNNDLATVRVNVEDVEETAAEVVEIVRNNPVILAAVAFIGAAAGFGVGWKIAKNHVTVEYEVRLAEELASAKEYYKRSVKAEEYATPEQAAESLLAPEAMAALREYRGESVGRVTDIRDDEDGVEVTMELDREVAKNVFVKSDDWDYDAEIQNRSDTRPYVISHEEFLENEPEHNQSSLTYYEGDDTLCAEDDSVVNDVDGVIGNLSLTRFGQGSNDNNVVYVRNPVSEMDFEVLRSRDKYTKAVLNYVEHSEPRGKTRRFRDSDD